MEQTRKMKRNIFKFSRKTFSYPYMLFLLIFVVVPLVLILINAFLVEGDEGKVLSLDNFVSFFSDSSGLTVLLNSLII
ncbi:MAG: hypothetical protein RR291_00860, partial [Clostridia bacterium]